MKPSTVRRLAAAATFAVLATGAPALASSPSSNHPVRDLLEAIPAWAEGVPAALLPKAEAIVAAARVLAQTK